MCSAIIWGAKHVCLPWCSHWNTVRLVVHGKKPDISLFVFCLRNVSACFFVISSENIVSPSLHTEHFTPEASANYSRPSLKIPNLDKNKVCMCRRDLRDCSEGEARRVWRESRSSAPEIQEALTKAAKDRAGASGGIEHWVLAHSVNFRDLKSGRFCTFISQPFCNPRASVFCKRRLLEYASPSSLSADTRGNALHSVNVWSSEQKRDCRDMTMVSGEWWVHFVDMNWDGCRPTSLARCAKMKAKHPRYERRHRCAADIIQRQSLWVAHVFVSWHLLGSRFTAADDCRSVIAVFRFVLREALGSFIF